MMVPALAEALGRLVGPRWVRHRRAELKTYTMDGLPTRESYPGLVVMPGTAAEVREIVRLLHLAGVPFVARGAGTGLSGGAVADGDAVLIALTRMNRILGVDPARRRAVVQPGVVNARLSEAVAPLGLHYVPDPSSQAACTVGGNVAENAGGPHCLKYGVTTNHIVRLEVVLPDGSVVELGSPHGEPWGPDLVGLFVGSEGMFGIATEITVRLEPMPPSVRTMLADFPTVRAASEAVSSVIADRHRAGRDGDDGPGLRAAVEASIYAAGYPTDAAAVLLVELDGQAGRGGRGGARRWSALLRERGARDGAERLHRRRPRPALAGPQEGLRRHGPHRARSGGAGRGGAPLRACPTSWTGSARSATGTGSRSATSSTPATGICTRTSASTAATPISPRRVHRPAARSWRPAWMPAAASPASTAWAPTSSTTCRWIFDAETLARDAGGPAGLRSRPSAPIPGKVVPVHACREWRADAGGRDERRRLRPPARAARHAAAWSAIRRAAPRRRPDSADALSLVCRLAHDEGWKIRVEGQGTWLSADAPADLAVSTRGAGSAWSR